MKIFLTALLATVHLTSSWAQTAALSASPSSTAAPLRSGSFMDKLVAPSVAQARATYPEAKRRFLSGLPRGDRFLLVTRLSDARGVREQVFVNVQTIRDHAVSGTISSAIIGVSGFRFGDAYTFNEAELIDWTILHADGVEEGNYVGKFLESYARDKGRR